MDPAPDTGIAGVHLRPLTVHGDDRGSLTEVYRREWVPGSRGIAQANVSISRPGVLRGLHWHRRQADAWCVLTGVAHVGLVDLREGSPTRLATFQRRIDPAEARFALAIPPGVAHGFYAETQVVLQYLVDAPYTGDDEFGLAWDDPAVGLAWPSSDPILSARDRRNPPLGDVLRHPPAYTAGQRG
ncbi:MAG: dTDP-4-dehydrorhamnose 3,5-epimerase family protein [Actinomycetota bacterium]